MKHREREREKERERERVKYIKKQAFKCRGLENA